MDDARPALAARAPSRAYASYVLGVLVLVYVLNFVDRQLISILIEPIKSEFGASDAQMGILTGFAFAIFYTVAGIPVARLADVWVRRSVIAIGLAVWSGMTALTGLSRSFAELALARIGVGIGEAGGTPPSHALISDYFPPERRATALGVFALGVPLGTMLGYSLGGWIGEHYGWRAAFVWIGLPGVALALLVRLTVREPLRGVFDAPRRAPGGASARDVLRHLFALRSFRWIVPGVCIASFSGYGFAVWKPVFLMRVHDFSMTQAGLWIGLLSGATGFLSTLAGGVVADWLARRDPSWALRLCAFSVLCAIPFQLAFLLWPDPIVALLVFVPGGLVGGMWPPPTYAATQNLVPPHMRALASAILLFFLNLVGLGAGPWAVGLLSDRLAPAFAGESVRWALVIPLLFNGLGAFAYWRASKSYAAELAAGR
jgi:predicted MFS family arabinose efflux permease